MKRFLFAAVAVAAFASPAAARDGTAYVGFEAGLFAPQESHVDRSGPPVTTGASVDWLGIKSRVGYDADLVGGYDFGLFRLEAEIAHKHAGHSTYNIDPFAPGPFPVGINPGGVYSAHGSTNVTSFMVNGLVDLGLGDGISFYAGAGAGPAVVSMAITSLGGSSYHLRDWDSFAWQGIAGFRVPISSSLDAGIKYRYFSADSLKSDISAQTFDARSFVHSHSVLASLTYNFGTAAPPPPPPPPPPATQTCPDGSVIDATATCPAPPPPPPPPPPATKGERG